MKRIYAMAVALAAFIAASAASAPAARQIQSVNLGAASRADDDPDMTPQTLPEGLQTQKWWLSYAFGAKQVDVAIDGDTFWVDNLAPEEFPGIAFKGTIDGDKVVFKTGQYFGKLSNGIDTYDFWFMPLYTNQPGLTWDNAEMKPELVMNYDAAARNLTCDDDRWGFALNANPDELFYLHVYQNAHLLFQDTYQPAMPQSPCSLMDEELPEEYWDTYGMSTLFVYLPLESTDNKILDRENYFYSIYVDDAGEPMTFDPEDFPGLEEETTEMPFNFTDDRVFYTTSNYHAVYLQFGGYEKLGVQGIYRINGVENRTPIVYTDGSVGIDQTPTDIFGNNGQPVYYDLTGRRVNEPQNGIFVKMLGGKATKVKI